MSEIAPVEAVEADPKVDPVDEKQARADAIASVQAAKAAVLKAAADTFDAKIAAALADDAAPVPSLKDLDYFGNKRRALLEMRRRAESLVTNILNATTAFEADLAAGNDPVVLTWDEFVGGV